MKILKRTQSEHDSRSEASTIALDISDNKKQKKQKPPKKTEPQDLYVCSHCAHHTKDWENFENHNKIMHRVHNMFRCTVLDCYKFYLSKNGLKGHCSHEHKIECICGICKFVTTGPATLDDHMKSHGQKKFKCPFCTKGFGSSYDQNRHQVKCMDNPNRATTCKKCLEQGSTIDVAGAEAGLVIHLQSEHNLRGDWFCAYCHRLYITETRYDTHFEKCKKAHGKLVTKSSTEDESQTD